MKIVPALFFVAVGVWVAFTYPDVASTAFSYIQLAVDWVVGFFNSITQ
jgi:hypothetical protein